MSMKLKRLEKGNTIGFFSASAPITYFCPDRLERGKDFLGDKGFGLKEGSLTGKMDFYRSGSIQERAEEFNSLLRDNSVDCIISTIGGLNSNSILPYIDYEYFAENPKMVIGYSDITAILMALYAKTGISTFYGPALVASFGEFEPFAGVTYSYFEDVLSLKYGEEYAYKMPEFWTNEFIDWNSQDRSKKQIPNEWQCVSSGKAEGRLIVGNLQTMMGIWNTQYMPTIQEGDILFIEDCESNIASLEKSFSLLKCSDIFDKISGLIIGKYDSFDDRNTGRTPIDVLLEVMGTHNIPILSGVDCSHTHPMFTMPIGGHIKLDAGAKSIILKNNYTM